MENPEGSREVIQQGGGGNGHSVQRSRFDGSLGIHEEDQQIEDENLNHKREEGGGVVVESLPPVGWPVMKGPESIQKIVCAAKQDPGKSGRAGGHPVVSGVPAKVIVTQGKDCPNQEGIENRAGGSHHSKPDNSEHFRPGHLGAGFQAGFLGRGQSHPPLIMGGRLFRGNGLERSWGGSVQET